MGAMMGTAGRLELIRERRAAGISWDDIAGELGLRPSTLHTWVRKLDSALGSEAYRELTGLRDHMRSIRRTGTRRRRETRALQRDPLSLRPRTDPAALADGIDREAYAVAYQQMNQQRRFKGKRA